MSTNNIDKLQQLNVEAGEAGGKERTRRQRAKGKQTARERLEALVDPGSFIEFDRLAVHDCYDFTMQERRIRTDGVICGTGRIDGRQVALFSQDATIFGGSLSHRHAAKICKVMDFAQNNGIPIIGLNESGGARIQEGVRSLAGYADIFLRNTLLSGMVPQISAVLGPCAGGAVYSPAITDFVFMVAQQSYMFVTGPEVVSTVTHESVTMEELGGAAVHNSQSGVAHFTCRDEENLFTSLRALLSFLPANYMEKPPSRPCNDPPERQVPELDQLVPENPHKPYDIKRLILATVDQGEFLEVQPDYAQNIVMGFARYDGMVVGIVANQPMVLAGCLDINASLKAARFVRFLDCFNIPILTLVDVPGFLPGVDQEHHGIIRNGAKLLYAYAEATVPKITLITRKAYGGAYDVMCSKHIRADVNMAFPTAEIAVMGPEGAVNIIFREELKKAADPEKRRAELVKDYRDKFANPFVAAELGYVDEIILPHDSRSKIVQWLKILQGKRQSNPPKKHGNIPL